MREAKELIRMTAQKKLLHFVNRSSILAFMLTFKRIVSRPVVVKLKRPIKAKIATIDDWPLVVIDLYTNEGIVGTSYLQPYVVESLKYIVPMIDDINKVLENKALSPYDNYEEMRKSLHFVGYEGLSLIAVSGVDMAIWDAMAKAANMPLCNFLGGSVGEVKAYNSNGLWLAESKFLASEATGLVDEGNFSAIKMRLGRENFNDDLKAINTVRQAVGEQIKLMVDFNQSLTLDEALNRCHRLDDLNLSWIEEPLIYDNYEGYSRLTTDIKTPIQLGENFYGPRELYKALQMGASDLVMPDFMRIGGISGWLKSAAIAEAAGIPISTHLYPEVGAHVMRVSQTAHWLEWLDWADEILKEPFSKENGFIKIPDKPGLGIEWDEAAIAKNAYS